MAKSQRKNPQFGEHFNASSLVDAFLQSDQRPSELLQSVLEARKIQGIEVLTKRERQARDRRRAKSKRQDPQAARKRKLAFRRNKAKIQAGLKKFRKSARGKKSAKVRGIARRKGLTNWIDQHAPGTIELPENKLDLTPYQEAIVFSQNVIETPTMRKMVVEFIEELQDYADQYVDFIGDSPQATMELDEALETILDYVEASVDGDLLTDTSTEED